jgi:hypothetical protein
MVRFRQGRYECAQCRIALEVPPYATPVVTIIAASGKPNMRAVSIDGVEIHRCVIASGETTAPISPDAA